MTIEKASISAVEKPWGSLSLLPWSNPSHGEKPIGELWFGRAQVNANPSSLLLKLIFAKEALSIQVHPDDKLALAMGLPNGKTEAWYVLSADSDAQVALGLKQCVTKSQLQQSIQDGSISDMVDWRNVKAGAVIFVPAGTIHAIGSGIVLAEIQQRSDTTFRLYDFHRNRTLDVQSALNAAFAGPAAQNISSHSSSTGMSNLIVCPQFELNIISLPPGGLHLFNAERETWLLVLEGSMQLGELNAVIGEAVFLEDEITTISSGAVGLKCLCARTGATQASNFQSGMAQSISAHEQGTETDLVLYPKASNISIHKEQEVFV